MKDDLNRLENKLKREVDMVAKQENMIKTEKNETRKANKFVKELQERDV